MFLAFVVDGDVDCLFVLFSAFFVILFVLLVVKFRGLDLFVCAIT